MFGIRIIRREIIKKLLDKDLSVVVDTNYECKNRVKITKYTTCFNQLYMSPYSANIINTCFFTEIDEIS